MTSHKPIVRSLVLFFFLALPGTAAATGGDTWPTLGHDAARTSRSLGQGDMQAPGVAWQRPLGGALTDSQVEVADTNGDGVQEIVLVSSGKVVVRRSDGTLVWVSPPIGATRIVGLYDLDGQGQKSVVALGSSPMGLYVLSALNGMQQWFQPTSSTAVDVLVVPGAIGSSLFMARQQSSLSAWQFQGGILDPSSNLSWETTDGHWSVDMVAVDLDGDGTPELVRGRDRGFIAYDVASGAVKCDASGLVDGVQAPTYFPALSAADVDGDGRDEVVLYDPSYFYSEDVGVFVVRCTGSELPYSVETLWSQQWVTDQDGLPGTNVNDKQIRYLANGVTECNGQAGLEMVYSLWDGSQSRWTTVNRNAATGAVIASKADYVLEAAADLDDDGRAEALLRQASGIGVLPKPFFSQMRLFDLHIGVFHDRGWVLDKGRAATVPARRGRVVTAGAGPIAASQNTNGINDPAAEVYVFSDAPGQGDDDPRPGRLLSIHGADGATLAQYDFPASISGAMMLLAGGMAQAGSEAEALVMLNDGGLRLLDMNLAEFGKLQPGNFAPMPAVVSFDGTSNKIVAVDSTDTLVALDGTQLANGTAVLSWKFRDATQTESRGYVNAPGVMVPGLPAGGASLVFRGHKIGLYEEQSLFALNASGGMSWSTDMGTGRMVGGFENFELLDDLDGGGVRDLFLTEAGASGTQELVVRRGEDGATLAAVATNAFYPGADFLQGHASADINGDGRLDIVSALHGNWFVGIDVSQAATGDPVLAFAPIFVADASPNGQAIIGELDGDPEPDLLRVNSQNAFGPYERRDLAGTVETSYQGPHPGVPSTDANLVALVARPAAPGQFDLAWAGMAGDALGIVSLLEGVTFGQVWSVALAAGVSYPLAQAPVNRAALYDPIAADVDGDGVDEIVVGSNDGYVYALRIADGSLAFSRGVGAPVVHVIAADVDKDPRIELVATLGDGRLVALDQPGSYEADVVTPQPDAGPDAQDDAAEDASGGSGGSGGAAGAGGSAGASGADSGTGGQAGSESDAGADAGGSGGGGEGAAPASDSGCGCRTAPRESSGFGLLSALVGAVVVSRIRRSRRSRVGLA